MIFIVTLFGTQILKSMKGLIKYKQELKHLIMIKMGKGVWSFSVLKHKTL